jgi:peptidoglycan/LPS O-acetylase OafA/YrhL
MSKLGRNANTGASGDSDYPQSILADLARPDFCSFLDLTRWAAAAIVFLGHLRNPLFLSYAGLSADDRNPFVQGWYFVTGWFGEAVIVFFVLSGFLVGGMGLARLHARTFDLAVYVIDRTSRLYVAFLPALLLTVLLDHAGHAWFPQAGLYSHTQPMIAEKINTPPFDSMATPTNFVGNLVMLQNFRVPTYGSNTPLWTISAEFWFYFVFGLAAVLLLHRSVRARGAAIAMGAIVFAILGTGFLYLLGLWLIGVAVALIGRSRLERPLLALVLFVAVLIAARILHDKVSAFVWGQSVRDYGVVVSFAYLLYSMRSARSALLARLASFNRFMADFSFSLYLIHFPMLIFLSSIAFASGYFPGVATGYQPTDPQGLFLYVLIVVAVYLAAWGFSLLTERHTARLRICLNSIVRTRLVNW